MKVIFTSAKIITGCIYFGVLALAGCGKTTAQNNSGSKIIIGSNDFVDVPYSDAKYVQAIGIMKNDNENVFGGACTVTHIGNGYVITAGHCVPVERIDVDGKRHYIDDCTTEASLNVKWGYTIDHKEGSMKSQCEKVIWRQTSFGQKRAADFALVKYKTYPEAALKLNAKPLEKGEKIAIYSHPNGRPLQWSGWCTIENSKLPKEQDESDALSADGRLMSPEGKALMGSTSVGYPCDTEGGSSGAAVINSNYEVVGIHGGVWRKLNLNYATPLNEVLTVLKEFVPELVEE